MNADDRQVIRSALEQAECLIYPEYGKAYKAASWYPLKEQALALLDKPQPESAGDARELAERLGKECFSGVEGIAATWRESKAIEIIQAFASRIRAETLENLRKQLNHERHEFNRIAMQGPHKKSKDFIAGWFDANFNAKMQISYALTKPTGTP